MEADESRSTDYQHGLSVRHGATLSARRRDRTRRSFAVATRAPRGLVKKLLHLPVVLQRHGFGRLLGSRVLIIEHTGRRTGRCYQTPVEVVAHESHPTSWTVVAAWGGRPSWLATIEAAAAPAVMVAGRRYDAPVQQRLDPDEACDVLTAYVCAHPFAARLLCRALGWPDQRTPGALRRITRTVPLFGSRRPGSPAPPARARRTTGPRPDRRVSAPRDADERHTCSVARRRVTT